MSTVAAVCTGPTANLTGLSTLDQEAGQWFVLHAKSRQEKALAVAITAQDMACFLPLSRQVRFYGRRKVTVELPLFPGYVFLHGSIEQAYDINLTGRVARIIHVPDQRRFESEIDKIRLALAEDAPLDPHPYLKRGIRVEVRSGPMRGLRGMIADRTKNDRLILQVQMLGQASSLEIDGALLDPIC